MRVARRVEDLLVARARRKGVVAPVHATLQVRVDGVQVVPELKFTVELEAKFEGLRLVIKGGRVRALQPGAAWAEGEAPRRHRHRAPLPSAGNKDASSDRPRTASP